MTRFEEDAIARQHNSFSKQEAVQNFEKSCLKCCLKNLSIKCDKCSINATHNEMLNYFEVVAKRPVRI